MLLVQIGEFSRYRMFVVFCYADMGTSFVDFHDLTNVDVKYGNTWFLVAMVAS